MNEQTEGQTDRRTHDGHNAMTLARWPSASGAKNLGLFRKGLNEPHSILLFENAFHFG